MTAEQRLLAALPMGSVVSKTVVCATLLLLSLGACRARSSGDPLTSSTADDGATSGSDVVCTRERRPGSRTKIKVCRSAEQREADREALERSRRSGAGSAPVGEGRR
jgi:hypothetical protein